ncbi:Phospholipase A-2-activating protein [Acropora cervicornis]|uniref:Phospholipase A-2-activating protein n=1 Tax=Acropora cervicornis TaxID=6130 RepID=A0AAD9VA69_ACRCE|nr:Phospholipase A-2-activating protein [Acropora cervicornis]
MSYKLSCVLRGHELDVRALCPAVFPEGGIITASRDRTARLWIPREGKLGFDEGHVLSGHEKFISAVCAIPPSDKYKHGLIATGGHDNVILVWTLDSLEPLQRLEGHTGPVCSLIAGKFGTLLSGSWDKTACIWIGSRCMMTLQGHEAAVWAVQMMPEHGLMLTGSADKTIKLWKAGTCQRTFTGHSDCVRGLAVLSAVEFVSSSNDCTIRRWLSTGECLQVYTGHTSFIYSIATLPNEGGGFVSVGEDRTLRIWKGGECFQTITLPAQSIWSVTCLNNGDIVTGSSDGIARVFTSCVEQVASQEELEQFNAEVASHAIPAEAASGQLGDYKLEDLSGPEVLLRPGNESGQTKLIRRGNIIECHQWNGMETRWEKVGEVVGSAGTEGASRQSNKQNYNGKEYDFVFDVEIQEGSPRLKLPYNLTDDPWMAAHQFLERNGLSQMFLDQVVDFIQKNTKGEGRGIYHLQHLRNKHLTPLPEERVEQSILSQVPIVTDQDRPRRRITPPQTSFVSFDSANIAAIGGKLKEFNATLDEEQQLGSEELKTLLDLLEDVASSDQSRSPKMEHLSTLVKALKWPSGVLFPALDIFRLAVRFSSVAKLSCSGDGNPQANVLLSFRIFSNMFLSEEGAALTLRHREKIVEHLSPWCKCSNKNIRILENETDNEARFRSLVAVGTLICGDADVLSLAQSLGMESSLRELSSITDPLKVGDCASKVLAVLSE